MVCYKPEGNGNSQNSTEEGQAAANNSKPASSSSDTKSKVANMAATEVVSSNLTHKRAANVLLATAVVLVEDETGSHSPARALLDSGSQCNFISERMRQRLKVLHEKVDISVLGVGNAATRVTQRIQAIVKSRVT